MHLSLMLSCFAMHNNVMKRYKCSLINRRSLGLCTMISYTRSKKLKLAYELYWSYLASYNLSSSNTIMGSLRDPISGERSCSLPCDNTSGGQGWPNMLPNTVEIVFDVSSRPQRQVLWLSCIDDTDQLAQMMSSTDSEACGLHLNVDCDYRIMDATAQYRIAMY